MRVVRDACEQFEGEARLRDAEPIEVVEHPREEGPHSHGIATRGASPACAAARAARAASFPDE